MYVLYTSINMMVSYKPKVLLEIYILKFIKCLTCKNNLFTTESIRSLSSNGGF
jgi:hypothetical protein